MGDINKVIFGDRTLIDLTADTVTEDTLLSGFTAHRRDGEIIEGTVHVPEILNDLDDVNIENPNDGDILTYNSSNNSWINSVLPPNIAKVLAATEAQWNSNPQMIAEADTLYIYTDHDTVDGQPIPAMKVGDGTSYLIDKMFITDNTSTLLNHINDLTIHTNSREKAFWNNKVACDESQIPLQSLLILTTEEI